MLPIRVGQTWMTAGSHLIRVMRDDRLQEDYDPEDQNVWTCGFVASAADRDPQFVHWYDETGTMRGKKDEVLRRFELIWCAESPVTIERWQKIHTGLKLLPTETLEVKDVYDTLMRHGYDYGLYEGKEGVFALMRMCEVCGLVCIDRKTQVMTLGATPEGFEGSK